MLMMPAEGHDSERVLRTIFRPDERIPVGESRLLMMPARGDSSERMLRTMWACLSALCARAQNEESPRERAATRVGATSVAALACAGVMRAAWAYP